MLNIGLEGIMLMGAVGGFMQGCTPAIRRRLAAHCRRLLQSDLRHRSSGAQGRSDHLRPGARVHWDWSLGRVGKVIRRRRGGRDHQYVARTWPRRSRCSGPILFRQVWLVIHIALLPPFLAHFLLYHAPRPEHTRDRRRPRGRGLAGSRSCGGRCSTSCLRCARRSRRWIFGPGRDSP